MNLVSPGSVARLAAVTLLSSLLTLAGTLGAGSVATAAVSAVHPTLNVGLSENVYTLDPALSTQLDDRYVSYGIYDTLFTFNKSYTIQPDLVRSWSNPTPNSYLFRLRPHVFFSNGAPFDAKVVQWNLDRELNPKTNSPETKLLAKITSVQVVNFLTVKINLSSPAPELLAILADRAGMMIDPTAFEACQAGKYGAQGGCPPVGTGPYELTSWSTPDTLTLVPNPHYYARSQVGFKQVVFHVVPDNTTRVTELRNGELDVIDALAPNDATPLKSDPSVVVHTFKTLNWDEFSFNLKDKPFNLLDVRQAMAYALNRAEVLKVAFSGFGNANPHYITGGWAYNPSLKTYPYDPAKALALLKAAGYAHGFTFKFYIPSGSSSALLAAQVIQSNLAVVHVKAVIQQMADSALYAADLAGQIDVSIGTWTPRADPGFMLELHYLNGSTQDYYAFDNAQVNQDLTQANSTYVQATRKKLLDQAEMILEQQLPTLYLVQPDTIVALSSHITGYVWLPDGILRVGPLGWK